MTVQIPEMASIGSMLAEIRNYNELLQLQSSTLGTTFVGNAVNIFAESNVTLNMKKFDLLLNIDD